MTTWIIRKQLKPEPDDKKENFELSVGCCCEQEIFNNKYRRKNKLQNNPKYP